jgi:hypothetical protein
MLLHLRHKLAESPDPEERAVGEVEKLLARGYARLMSGPGLVSLLHKVGRIVQAPFLKLPASPFSRKGRWIRRAPFPLLSRWTRARDLPALPPRTFHEIWQQELAQESDVDA